MEKLFIVGKGPNGKLMLELKLLGDWYDADTILKSVRLILKNSECESISMEHALAGNGATPISVRYDRERPTSS